MAHLHYEEEQRFSNVTWIWIALLLVLLAPLIIWVTEKEVGQQDILMIMLSTAFAALPVVAIMFYSRLLVKIDEQGIHYKFFPSVLKWRLVPKEIIESYEVTDTRNLLEKLECGYRRNRFSNCIGMNISGKKFTRIKLKDGRKLKIGTGNPEGMERALRKLISPNNFT